MKLLITAPVHFMPKVKEEFGKLGSCTFIAQHTKEYISSIISQFDGWVCQPCPLYKIDTEILQHATLKFIATPSTGTNHIDVQLCKERGITVLSIKDSQFIKNIKASSEFTFAMLLAAARQINKAIEYAKNGHWRDIEDNLRGFELCDKTLGIIGFGRIGSNNAKYAHAMGMKIITYDPYVHVNEEYVQQKQTALDVLREADMLMVCVHLSQDTKYMVSGEWFDSMKDGVVFINTSRGEIVDEDALLANLESGKVRAAAVDVISNEHCVSKNHKLIQYVNENDNLIITPHIAGLTYESELKAARFIIKQIEAIL